MNEITRAATEICSAMQYLVDRGEIEDIMEVETSVRYTSNVVREFVVVCGGRRIKFTAKDIGEADIDEEDFDEDPSGSMIQLETFDELFRNKFV